MSLKDSLKIMYAFFFSCAIDQSSDVNSSWERVQSEPVLHKSLMTRVKAQATAPTARDRGETYDIL